MPRKSRYQGAVIENGCILLVQHHFFSSDVRYWGLPGGGQEPGETGEETVRREMREETGLEVKVVRLLYETFWDGSGIYESYKTYLCTPLAGTARPGYEPEPEASSVYEIAAVRWLNLADEQSWGEDLRDNPVMGPELRRIRDALEGDSTG